MALAGMVRGMVRGIVLASLPVGSPVLAQTVSSTGVALLPRVSVGGSLVFDGPDTIRNRGISASHSVSGISTTPNAGIYELNITGDTARTPTYFNGLTLNYLGMGTNGGGRAGLAVQFSVTTQPASSVGDANYVGISPVGYADVNVGGTGARAAGNITASNPNVRLAAGATQWGTVNGQETNAGLLAGSSARIFYGQSIVHNSGSAVNGSIDDAGLSFNDQDDVTARWLYGIGFGSHAAQWPIAPSGTIIGAIARTVGPRTAPVQALNGIDFRAVAFQPGGHSIAVPGFSVDPAGNTVATGLNTPSLRSTGTLTLGKPGGDGQPVVTAAASADQAYARIVARDGGVAHFEANVSEHFLDPVGPIGRFTETLPAAPADGQVADISCGQAIRRLIVTAAPGQRLRPDDAAVTTSCSATQGHRWKFRAPQAAWNQIF